MILFYKTKILKGSSNFCISADLTQSPAESSTTLVDSCRPVWKVLPDTSAWVRSGPANPVSCSLWEREHLWEGWTWNALEMTLNPSQSRVCWISASRSSHLPAPRKHTKRGDRAWEQQAEVLSQFLTPFFSQQGLALSCYPLSTRHEGSAVSIRPDSINCSPFPTMVHTMGILHGDHITAVTWCRAPHSHPHTPFPLPLHAHRAFMPVVWQPLSNVPTSASQSGESPSALPHPATSTLPQGTLSFSLSHPTVNTPNPTTSRHASGPATSFSWLDYCAAGHCGAVSTLLLVWWHLRSHHQLQGL